MNHDKRSKNKSDFFVAVSEAELKAMQHKINAYDKQAAESEEETLTADMIIELSKQLLTNKK
jgi:hypothetical protein